MGRALHGKLPKCSKYLAEKPWSTGFSLLECMQAEAPTPYDPDRLSTVIGSTATDLLACPYVGWRADPSLYSRSPFGFGLLLNRNLLKLGQRRNCGLGYVTCSSLRGRRPPRRRM